MPDIDDIILQDDIDESSVLKDLRQKAKRVDDAEAKVKSLETQVAILGAGLTDLTPAKQKALLAAHEGDLTAEAIRDTAVELGFAESPEQAPQVPAEEQAAIQRAQQLTAGAAGAGATPESLDDLIAKADTPEALKAILEGAGVVTVMPD